MSEEIYAAMAACLPSDFDLAGGIHEDMLDDFSDAHHRKYYNAADPSKPSIYRGGDSAPDLGISKWSYDIAKPATFDLSPIQPAEQQRAVSRWFTAIPEAYTFSQADQDSLLKKLLDDPNMRLTLNQVIFRVEFDPNVSDPPPPSISVSLKVSATGIVQIDPNNAFVFTPLRIDVDDAPAAIQKALEDAGIRAGTEVKAHGSSLCYPIEALMKHMIRAFLQTRLNQYLINLPLPSSIDLFKGYSVGRLKSAVCNDYLIAYGSGQIAARPTIGQSQAVALSGRSEVSQGADHACIVGSSRSDKAEEAADGIEPVENEFYSIASAKGGYILLWISKRLFNAAADKNLNIDDGGGGSDSSGPFSWSWSWWMRLRNRGVDFFDANKIRVALDFAAGGGARFRMDLKIGSISHGTDLVADLEPKPNRIDMQLVLDSARKKIKLRADTKPGLVAVHPKDWWDVFGWLISAVLTLVGTAIFNLIDFALNFILIDVADLPDRFPGTDLEYKTFGFATSFWGQEHYMVTLGIDFQ